MCRIFKKPANGLPSPLTIGGIRRSISLHMNIMVVMYNGGFFHYVCTNSAFFPQTPLQRRRVRYTDTLATL